MDVEDVGGGDIAVASMNGLMLEAVVHEHESAEGRDIDDPAKAKTSTTGVTCIG